MHLLPRFLISIVSNYAEAGISALVLFFLTPFVIHTLGDVAYAVWVLLHAVVSYLHFFELGLHSALIKYAAEAPDSDTGRIQLQRLLGTTLVLFLGAGLAALAASGAIAIWIAPRLTVSGEWVWPLQQGIVLLGVDVVFRFVSLAPRGLLAGRQRYDILNAIDIAGRGIQAGATVGLLLSGYGLLSLVVLEVGCTCIGLVASLVLVHRLYPQLSLSFGLFDRATWRRVRGYSFWALMHDLALYGGSQLDSLLIPVFLSLSLLTPYAVACSIGAVLFWLTEPFVEALFPFSSALRARDEAGTLGRLLIHAGKAAVAIACPFALLLLLMGESIIANWVGPEYVPKAAPVLWLVVPSFWITAVFSPATGMLAALSRVREVFLLTLAEICLAAGGVALSVGTYGLVGLAASCLVANVLMSFGGVLPLACSTLGVPVRRYLREALVRPLLPAIPTAALGLALGDPFELRSWLEVAELAALLLGVYAIGFALLSVSKTERNEIYRYATHLLAPGAS